MTPPDHRVPPARRHHVGAVTTAARSAWSPIRTGAIAGWSAGAVLAVVTHSPMLSSIGAGVLAGIASGATYVLLARVLGARATRSAARVSRHSGRRRRP